MYIYIYSHYFFNIYIYIVHTTVIEYSGIFNYRRCLSGVWQKPFQIEDITRFQSSSNDQKSKNKPFNLGMICAISSICFFFVQLPFFVVFPGKLYKINRTWTPGPGWLLGGDGAKVAPGMGPGRSYFGTAAIEGGVSEKLEKTMGFLAFLIRGLSVKPLFK